MCCAWDDAVGLQGAGWVWVVCLPLAALFSVSAGHFSPLETQNGKGWGEAESGGPGNDISSLFFFPPSLASLDVTSGPVDRREGESTFS